MTDFKKTRLNEIETLISNGVQSTRIAEQKADEWGVSERQVWKYISEVKEQAPDEGGVDEELVKTYAEFKESDHKLKIWQETDFDRTGVYKYPEDEIRGWNEFIRYGWATEDRIKEVIQEDKTGLQKLDEYCEGVRSGEINVCKWIRLAVDRHYENLKRQSDEDFPYYFEPAAALHYIKFFEHELPHHTGAMSGESIIFEPWQWFSFGSLFGWLKKERFMGFPLRRFKTGFIFVPKKNGKSLISGGTGIYMMDYDGWPGAQCFIIATSQSHAMELGYRDATIMINKNESLLEKYTINRSAGSMGIYYEANNSYYKPITSKADSEDGKNVHFCGPDETKDLIDHSIYDLMEEGMISAPNGMMLNTTTAGFNTESLGYDHQQYLERILSGKETDESAFGVIFTIDEEDKEKEGWWCNLDLYKKANPNYGISVFESGLTSKFSKAKSSLSKRSSLVTKHLNEWTSSNSAFISEEKWNACSSGKMPGMMHVWEDVLLDYRGMESYGGLDLGGNSDFTSFELVTGEKVFSFFWIPKETIKERKNASLIREFVDQNYVYATDGDWTDHDFVEECIKKIAEIVDLKEVAYDRYKMSQMVTHLQDEGIEMTPFGQGYVSMNPAIDELEDKILKKQIDHFSNPVLTWMNGNVSIKKDPAGNRKFDKEKSQDKIDGMVALAMALGRVMLQEVEEATDGELFVV